MNKYERYIWRKKLGIRIRLKIKVLMVFGLFTKYKIVYISKDTIKIILWCCDNMRYLYFGKIKGQYVLYGIYKVYNSTILESVDNVVDFLEKNYIEYDNFMEDE